MEHAEHLCTWHADCWYASTMTCTRSGSTVVRAGIVVGVLTKGRWHRPVEGDLVPLEPLVRAADGPLLQACVLARPAPGPDPVAQWCRERMTVLDRIVKPRGMR
jgi:hypothetical protein